MRNFTASLGFAALVMAPSISQSAQTTVNGPAGSMEFGTAVKVLENGNFIVTDPEFDKPQAGPAVNRAGAVHLYSPGGVLISTLTGSTADDSVGSEGIVVLPSGKFLVLSPAWNGTRGAVTMGHPDTGFGAAVVEVSSSNSLVGSTADDRVGGARDSIPPITILANGAFVIRTPRWDQTTPSAVGDVGAVTWADGDSGVTGVISEANSLVGTAAASRVGGSGVVPLADGDYVVMSPRWNSNRGAATWGSGATGVSGAVSSANSLVGTGLGNDVGGAVTELANGHYVVVSPNWDGSASDSGATTWCNGDGSTVGTVSTANSLTGSTFEDKVGLYGVRALTNGHYVVVSPEWGINNYGAVTWCDGNGPTAAVVSSANSLVGSVSNDHVGSPRVTPLTNGNYVVASSSWGASDFGAATWGDGDTGISGVVSAANSLVGTSAGDEVSGSNNSVVPLPNGNYLVTSPAWRNGATSAADAGAVTYCNGVTGAVGAVSATNSLVGTKTGDEVGYGGIILLADGDYIVCSPYWDNGSTPSAGAATWGHGTNGVRGAVSASNSLIGSKQDDGVGWDVRPLPNGNYVVLSRDWDNGALADAGAMTMGNGSTGTSGAVSPSNSIVGAKAGDGVGADFDILANGHYVLTSSSFDRASPAVVDVGAVTWVNGAGPFTGTVTEANSLFGGRASDFVGAVAPLSDGNYIVHSSDFDNGGIGNAGAVTYGSGASGVTGLVSASNSVIGNQFSESFDWSIGYDPVRKQVVIGRPHPTINRVTLFTVAPEIAVEQPVGAGLTSAVSSIDFGSPTVGVVSAPKTFTIKNVGEAPLTLGSIGADGGESGDFAVNTAGMLTTVAPGSSTTFAITFTPRAAGARSTTLSIESDDASENPFEIALTGTGSPPPGVLAFQATGFAFQENAGTVDIPIVRTGGSFGSMKVKVSSTNGTATAGSDYTALPANYEVTFGDGETLKHAQVTLTDTGTAENNETFTLTLSSPMILTPSPGAGALGLPASAAVTIVDTSSLSDTVAPPAPTITAPAVNGPLSGVPTLGTFTVTGTATDAKGVKRVEVTLNNDTSVNAVLAAPGGTSTNYSLAITPRTGANTLQVKTVDYGDKSSPVTTRTFTTLRPLGVIVDAAMGSVTAGFTPSPTYREVGKSITITATPKVPTGAFPGSIFTGWTIDWDANTPSPPDVPVTLEESAARINVAFSSLAKPTLTFIFREGMNLTANFEPNPFWSLAGVYNGLIETGNAHPSISLNSTEGFFTATVQNTGAFTGKMTIDGMVLNLAGAFDDTGTARFGTSRALTLVVPRTGKPSLKVALLASLYPPFVISGLVEQNSYMQSQPVGISTVLADRAFFGAQVLPGGLTSGQPSVLMASTATRTPGEIVTGAGIPANTTILAVNSETQITLDKGATATNAAASLTFTRNLDPDYLAAAGANGTFTAIMPPKVPFSASPGDFIAATDRFEPSQPNDFGEGDPIVFVDTGGLPLELDVSDTYYVVNKVGNSFQIQDGSSNTIDFSDDGYGLTYTDMDYAQHPGYARVDFPQGHGIGTFTISKAGVASFAGTLADGTAVTSSSTLSEPDPYHYMAFYASLYSAKGYISGFVALDKDDPTSDLSATDMYWMRPIMTTSQYYPAGWEDSLIVDLFGAKYNATGRVLKRADGADEGDIGDELAAPDLLNGNALLNFSDGSLGESLSKVVSISATNVVTKVPDNDPTFSLTITASSGALAGTLTHTDDSVPTFKGIIYQKGENAGGYGHFLAKQPLVIDYRGESGAVELLGKP